MKLIHIEYIENEYIRFEDMFNRNIIQFECIQIKYNLNITHQSAVHVDLDEAVDIGPS
jgi:hypothetical protein